jgi:hypothetical protein
MGKKKGGFNPPFFLPIFLIDDDLFMGLAYYIVLHLIEYLASSESN